MRWPSREEVAVPQLPFLEEEVARLVAADEGQRPLEALEEDPPQAPAAAGSRRETPGTRRAACCSWSIRGRSD